MENIRSLYIGLPLPGVANALPEENHSIPNALNVDWGALGTGDAVYKNFAQGQLSAQWSAAARDVVAKINGAHLSGDIQQNLFVFLKRLGFTEIESMSSSMNVEVAKKAFIDANITDLLKTVSNFLLKIDELLQQYQQLPNEHEKSIFRNNLELYLLQATDGMSHCGPGVLYRLNYFLTISNLINSTNPIKGTLGFFKNELFNQVVLDFYRKHSSIPELLRQGSEVHYVSVVKSQMALELELDPININDVFASGVKQYVIADLNQGLSQKLQSYFSQDVLFFKLAQQCIEDFKADLKELGVQLPIQASEWNSICPDQITLGISKRYGHIESSLFFDVNKNNDKIFLQDDPTLIALQLAENAEVFLGSESPNTKTVFQLQDTYGTSQIKKNGCLTWIDVFTKSQSFMHRAHYCHADFVKSFEWITSEEISSALSDSAKKDWLAGFFKKICNERNSVIAQKFLNISSFRDLAELLIFRSAKNHLLDDVKYLKEQGVVLTSLGLIESAERELFESIYSDELVKLSALLLVCPNTEIRNHNQETPFLMAIKHNRLDFLPVLINAGANVDKKYLDGLTPLMRAADEKKIDLMKYLIDHDADVNLQNTQGATALMFGVLNLQPDILSLLIDNGADVNMTDSDGRTAMDILEAFSNQRSSAEFQSCLNILNNAGAVRGFIQKATE